MKPSRDNDADKNTLLIRYGWINFSCNINGHTDKTCIFFAITVTLSTIQPQLLSVCVHTRQQLEYNLWIHYTPVFFFSFYLAKRYSLNLFPCHMANKYKKTFNGTTKTPLAKISTAVFFHEVFFIKTTSKRHTSINTYLLKNSVDDLISQNAFFSHGQINK